MGSPLTLSLGDDSATTIEPWTTPDLLSFARPDEGVDLVSVCLVASQLLYIMSGRRYGVRSETTRPIAGQRNCGWGDFTRMPYIADWMYRYRSNEGAPNSLQLKSPVQWLGTIKIDGDIVDPDTYQLYDNRTLIRLDGTWPIYQNISVADDEVGSFSITYGWGVPVPEAGKMAAQVFATELARYLNRDESAFSDRTISVTRQGVSQALDPTPFLSGTTGLYFVDSFIKTVNPGGARRRPSITSPESIMNARLTQ